MLRPISGKPVDRRDVYRMVARIAKTAAPPSTTIGNLDRHAVHFLTAYVAGV